MLTAAQLRGVGKRYGKISALKGIDLQIEKGKIYGLLGPNGAGKSTLIKLLVGSILPTEGEIKVLGLNPQADKWELRHRIGFMPQSSSLYEDLSARDNISFFANAYKLENIKERVEKILQFTELEKRGDDPVHTYSGGMKKRVSLACALIHEPEMIFLDEPTAAVDPHLKRRTWELFRELTDSGKSIFVSTHLMDEAVLCDELAVLRQGELVVSDTPEKILEHGSTQIILHTGDGEQVAQNVPSEPVKIAESLRKHGLDSNIKAVKLVPDTMEDVILSMIRKERR